MKFRIKSEQGVTHIALIAVVTVAVVAAGAGFLVYKHKSPNNDKLKADASGAYSTLCGPGYNLRHTQDGDGFKLYNYKNAAGRGCALVVNDAWGTKSLLEVSVTLPPNTSFWNSDMGNYKYYAGPIYYPHRIGAILGGQKNGKYTSWTITSE